MKKNKTKIQDLGLTEKTVRVLNAVREDNLIMTDRLIEVETEELRTIQALRAEIKDVKSTIVQNSAEHKQQIFDLKTTIENLVSTFSKIMNEASDRNLAKKLVAAVYTDTESETELESLGGSPVAPTNKFKQAQG